MSNIHHLRCTGKTITRIFGMRLLAGIFYLLPIMGLTQENYTVRIEKGSLETAISKVRSVTGAVIVYNKTDIVGMEVNAANYSAASIEQLLHKIVAGLHLQVKKNGRVFLLMKANPGSNDGVGIEKNNRHSESHTGTLKGRVVDFETAQPLPGATIRIVEAGKAILSDEKGYYAFSNLQEGKYTLIVTYTGYQNNKSVIEIQDGRTAIADIKMSAGRSLDEVVVTSGTRKVKAVTYTTENQLIDEIRHSNAVVSGVSNELIAKSADRTAAEIVKRISGITVVDEKFIVVRGMNQRYNITYLNGNIAPSTELYSRTFAYDLLPTPIIDRILVYKSPSAQLLGDYAGGAVEVFTKNAKLVKHLDVGVQLGYRPGSNFGSTIQSYRGGKYDWLGFDDGTRKLSPLLPGYFAPGAANGMTQKQLLQSFTPNLQYGTKKSIPDLQLFGNYFDNWAIGKWRLYDLTSLTFTRETTHYDIYRQAGNTYQFISGGYFGDRNYLGNDDQSTEKAKFNLLQNFTLRTNNKNRFNFNHFLLHEGSSFTSIFDSRMNVSPDKLASFNLKKKKIALSFQERLLYSGNLGGEHILGQDSRQTLKWNLGYSYSRQDIPDQRVMTFYSMYSPDGLDPYGYTAELPGTRWHSSGVDGADELFMGKISRIFTRNKERVYNASADYSFTLRPTFTLKAGTYHFFRSREVGRRFFKVNQGNLYGNEAGFTGASPGASVGYGSVDYNRVNFRMNQLGNIWNPSWFPEDGSGLKIFDMTTPADSYVASEEHHSNYIMGDWRPGKWDVSAGLRLEYNRQRVAGAYLESRNNMNLILPVEANNTTTSFLPSVNISWQPDSMLVVRSGYGRTVNRPEFREMTPYNDFDFLNNEVISGNARIRSATINNYDLRVEFYPRGAANEMISAGLFYKDIQHPIERIRNEATTSDAGSFTSISFINSDRARVYGVELELRKNLRFIPGKLFRNLSTVVNAAWIKSETEKNHFINRWEEDNIGRFSGRPLQGQAPYVINAGLFYENPGYGTKAGITYAVNGPSIYAISIRNPNTAASGGIYGQDTFRPSLVELERHLLDLSISQRIVKTLTMRLNIQNILDQPYRMIEDHNNNQRYDPEQPVKNAGGELYYQGDNIYRKYYTGSYFTLNIMYAF